MIRGAINSIDIMKHPFLLIKLYGWFNYLKLFGKCVSPATYLFLNIMPR